MNDVHTVISDDYSNHNLPIGAQVEEFRSEDGVTWYTQGGDGDEVAIDPRDLDTPVDTQYTPTWRVAIPVEVTADSREEAIRFALEDLRDPSMEWDTFMIQQLDGPHPKHGPGLCQVCGHYGDDCKGPDWIGNENLTREEKLSRFEELDPEPTRGPTLTDDTPEMDQ